MVALILLALAFFAYKATAYVNAGNATPNPLTFIAPPIAFAGETMEGKVEDMKADILTKIKNCERAGHSEADAIITFDTGGQASLGTFQFYRPTIIQYYKLLRNQEVSMREAALIAWDDQKAQSLASEIIFKDDTDFVKEKGGLFNWRNCAHSEGVIDKVRFIRQLEQ